MQVDGNDNVRNIKCLVLDTIEQNASDKIIKFRKTYVFSRKLTIALENMQLDLHIEYVHLTSNLMEYIAIWLMFVVCRPSRCRSLLVASNMCSRSTIGILPIYIENPYHKHSVSFQKLTCPSWVSHNDRCPRDFIPRG